ncbi:MAG: hypothetical protein OER92_08260 [Alphaproteobacteria bacterium]|nr:hypothetical protein [Alphaproteobacteria bacterium]
MIWWIVIPAVIAAALAFAYWEHRKQSRRLVNLFAPLATAHGGTIKPATVLALPQLRFEREGIQYFIGAMANGGPRVSGSATRPGFNGPFTFANLDTGLDTGQTLNIQRTDRLDRGASRLINSVSGGYTPISGDDAFDGAFRITSDDQAFVHRILNPNLRQKLLDSHQSRLEIAIAGAKIRVHIDDYVKSAGDLDEMIEIASLVADNCTPS